jgi:ribosomal protein S18 acetylase RimI-like enzyme
MQYTIRKATKEDVPQIKQLIEGLALYEKAPEAVTVTEAQLLEDGFGANPIYQCRVAEGENGKLLGFSLFYVAYSTWKGKLVYLDDFFVREEYRSLGIGKKLMDEVVLFAQAINANQVRWAVLEWNDLAIRFYKKLNVEFDSEWIFCRLTKQQILDYKP